MPWQRVVGIPDASVRQCDLTFLQVERGVSSRGLQSLAFTRILMWRLLLLLLTGHKQQVWQASMHADTVRVLRGYYAIVDLD